MAKDYNQGGITVTKKFISAILTLCFMLTSVLCLPIYAQSESTVNEEDKAVQILKSIGVYINNEAFDNTDTVTRGEFAKIICNIVLGENYKALSGTEVLYSDVKSTHTAFDAVSALNDIGLMIGFSDNTFKPEDILTNHQAITVIMKMLGYEMVAQAAGGYPLGYISTAIQYDISDSVGAESAITYEELSLIILNALKRSIMEPVSYEGDITYQVSKGENYLNKRFDTYMGEGQITSAGAGSLAGESDLELTQLIINGKIYETGSTDAVGMLGCEVTYYYVYDDDAKERTIVYIEPTSADSELIVYADEINLADTTATSLVYENRNGKYTDASISSAAYVVYNGVAAQSFSKSDFDIKSGYVKLIDTSSQSGYDVVIIESCNTYIVSDYSVSDERIYTKYGENFIETESKGSGNQCVITKDSQPFDPIDLKEWDVISVAVSRNGKFTKVYVSDATAEGSVDSISYDNSGYKITIGDTEYETVSGYGDSIKVGDSGVFFLDIYGKIAAFRSSDAINENYALLMDASTGGNGLANPQVKIFTMDSSWQIYDMADKVKYNDTASQNGKNVAQTLKSLISENGDAPIAIKYKLSSEEEITAISVADDRSSDEITLNMDRSDFSLDFAVKSARYESNKLSLAAQGYTTGQTTAVLVVPPYVNGQYDEDEFMATTAAGYFTSGVIYENTEFYDLNSDFTPGLIVVRETADSATVDARTEIAVIEKVAKGIDSNGEDTIVLYYTTSGIKSKAPLKQNAKVVTKETYTMYKTMKASEIKAGDILQLKIFEGEILNFRPLYIYGSSVNGAIQNNGGGNTETRRIETYYCKASDKNDKMILFDTEPDDVFFNHESANVYVFDVEKGECTPGSIGDVITLAQDPSTANNIFARANTKVLTDIVVYINE